MPLIIDTTRAHPACFADMPLIELLRFWHWLADEILTAPEFADLSDTDKTRLAMLLRATPTFYGPH
jgi:hypothetical protein